MCGRQPGPKSPNLKKVWGEAFHPFRKRHTASRRSSEIGNKLFAQVTAEEWVTRNPSQCAFGRPAFGTMRSVEPTSAECSLRLAGEADNLSTHSRLHSQTMWPPLAYITSVSGSLQISIQVNRESLIRTKWFLAPFHPSHNVIDQIFAMLSLSSLALSFLSDAGRTTVPSFFFFQP